MQKVSKAWRAFLRMLAGLIASMSIGVVAVSANETPVKNKDQSHNELVVRKGVQIELVAQAPPVINLAFTLSETTAPPKSAHHVGYMTSMSPNRCHVAYMKEGGVAVLATPIVEMAVLTAHTRKNVQSDSGFS